MAGSRMNKIGNIFSRATGLLRSGAMKYDDRPLWYDVYRVFPPKYEPRFDREVEGPTDVQPIFYGEDLVRADFLKRYGLNPGGDVRNLRKHGEEDACQRFIVKYNEVYKSHPDWTHEDIFDSVASTFPLKPSTRSSRSRRSSSAPLTKLSAEELEEQEDDVALNRALRQRPRRGLITASTLLTMFKEAKEESDHKNNNDDDDDDSANKR